MEREISISVTIGVSLIAMAALLWIVIFTVQIGNEVKNSAIESGVDLQAALKTGQIESMSVENIVLPAAAAYQFLEINYRVIDSSVCMICGKTYGAGQAGRCFLDHLTGKVSLQIIKLGSEKYQVIIHKPDCNWELGSCTC